MIVGEDSSLASEDTASSEFVMNLQDQRVSFCRSEKAVASPALMKGVAFPEDEKAAEVMRSKWRSNVATPHRVRNDFAFRDFFPTTFHKIRTLAKIDDQEYVDAFTETARESFSEGRSGAFLYFSKNERYIVKTTSKEEILKLIDMLPTYLEFLNRNPMSLITRYLSAHAIVMYNTTLYFVVMLNIFPNIDLSERYDLKGSWIDRNGNNVGEDLTLRYSFALFQNFLIDRYDTNSAHGIDCRRHGQEEQYPSFQGQRFAASHQPSA